MIAVAHPTVNAFVRALVEALDREGRLAAFHTTIAWGRRAVRVGRGRLHCQPWREMARLTAGRVGRIGRFGGRGPAWATVDAVYRALDRRAAAALPGLLAAGGVRAVYGYEDGSLAMFREARRLGLGCYYELPIAYWETVRRLLRAEAERWPEWEPTLGATRDPEEKLARKTEELALADTVICPSEFVRRSVPPGKRVVVAEFGSPPPVARVGGAGPGRRGDGRLRLLFAGSLTQRKGLADLLAAVKMLGRHDVELVVMGTPVLPLRFYRRQFAGFRYEPPRAHRAVLALMASCHVLVLPSIVEGRALVQQEAMSAGLPIIVTPNAGGEDLVEEGRTGFLVPPGAPDRLAEKIAWVADHREVLPAMGLAAREVAARKTWAAYTARIMEVLP